MSIETTVWAWKQDTGSPETKLVLVALSDLCGMDGRFATDMDRLAATAQIDTEGLLRAVAHLDVQGLVEIDDAVAEDRRLCGRLLMPGLPEGER